LEFSWLNPSTALFL